MRWTWPRRGSDRAVRRTCRRNREGADPARRTRRCRRGTPRGRTAILRACRPAGAFLPRLRNAAVRPVLSAPGHHLAPAACPRPPAVAEARPGRHRPADRAAAPRTPYVHRRACARDPCRRRTRPGEFSPAAGRRRVRQRAAGGRTGRVRNPRLAVRHLPDGQRDAVPDRPVRPAGGQHPRLRRGDAALRRAPGQARTVAGPRVFARRRLDPRLPPSVQDAVRGRPDAHAAVSRRGRRSRARWRRVLPAALFRGRGEPVRLPAGGRHRCARGRP